ncbi:CatB-related O-acetyltransferase [Priestia flexa]
MLGIKSNVRRYLFNFRNKEKNIILYSNVLINKKTKLEGNNIIHSNSQITNTKVGFGTYIASKCLLQNAEIGKYCCIASNVKIVSGQHPLREFVSVHPAFYSTKLQAGFSYVDRDKFVEHKLIDNERGIKVSIGNDVWIGQDVLILEGIKIADGTVIGAGAVVTKDTEPFSINVGVPAKKIDYRFNEVHRKFLMSLNGGIKVNNGLWKIKLFSRK